MIAFVRDGDSVIVHSMARLARNLDDLRRLVRTLTGKGVRVEFGKESLTFTGEDSPMATLLLSVMGAFAEFERSLILERQREGIAAAKAARRRVHRPQTRPHHRAGAATARACGRPSRADQLNPGSTAGGSAAAAMISSMPCCRTGVKRPSVEFGKRPLQRLDGGLAESFQGGVGDVAVADRLEDDREHPADVPPVVRCAEFGKSCGGRGEQRVVAGSIEDPLAEVRQVVAERKAPTGARDLRGEAPVGAAKIFLVVVPERGDRCGGERRHGDGRYEHIGDAAVLQFSEYVQPGVGRDSDSPGRGSPARRSQPRHP